MFARVQIYGRLMEAIARKGVPVSGVDLGANVLGTIVDRVRRLRAAVDAHAATGGRVVLVGHSMGTLVCARMLCEGTHGVSGFVSICGVFGGIRGWTLLGWPLFEVVREMARGTGRRMSRELREFLSAPTVPVVIFQADRDEFVRDQSPFAKVERFSSTCSHNGPVLHEGTIETIAARVAGLAAPAGATVLRP